MASAGELLREERIKRNLTVRELADSTRISARYLEALESNDLASLPGDFFYRAFLKQYATALDLDAPTTKRVLDAALPPVEHDPLPAMNAAYQVAQVDSRTSGERRTGTTGAIVLLVAVVVACSAMYAIWRKSETPVESAEKQAAPIPVEKPVAQSPAPANPEPATALPTPEPAAQSTPPESAATQAPPVVSTQAPATLPAVTPAPALAPTALPAGSTSVELAANEKTWVSLSSDGKTLFAGLLDASQTKSFAVGANAKLLAGNAGGVDVRFNGKPIGPLGPKGQVRIVTFSGGTFQIVTPPKKSGA